MLSRDLEAEVLRKMFVVLSFKSPGITFPALVSKVLTYKPKTKLSYFL